MISTVSRSPEIRARFIAMEFLSVSGLPWGKFRRQGQLDPWSLVVSTAVKASAGLCRSVGSRQGGPLHDPDFEERFLPCTSPPRVPASGYRGGLGPPVLARQAGTFIPESPSNDAALKTLREGKTALWKHSMASAALHDLGSTALSGKLVGGSFHRTHLVMQRRPGAPPRNSSRTQAWIAR